MKRWHMLDIPEIFESLQTGENGLSSEEAQKRLQKYGKNALAEDKKITLLQRFLEQFKDVMVIVLLVAAIISGVLGELADSLIILAIVIINAIIGVVQENKAEKALEALKSMSKPYARVYRDGEVKSIRREEIVPGDLVELEAGDYIPADIRLIQSSSLKIQESALTGESVAVEKKTDKIDDEEIPLGDRSNMAYTSGIITYGRGSGIVVSAGMDTEVGKIAEYINEGDIGMETPLKKRLNATGKVLSIAVLCAAVVIFITGMVQGRNPIDMFMTAVSLAVAAIPEGLPAIVTVVLALGVQRMSARKAIIRKLPAVETLGSTQVICSDKTGTLTLNEMTVKKTYLPGGDKDASSMDMLLKIMVLCNDTKTSGGNDDQETLGDPTETALIRFAAEKGLYKKELEQQHMREHEAPFDSERKLMTTVNDFDGESKALVKGAYDVLIEKCTHIYEDGEIRKILEEDIKAAEAASSGMSEDALRVLSYAFRNLDEPDDNMDVEELERDLVFVGLTGMIDPPREEVKEAMVVCRKAGMRPVMITGDHGNTAYAIAVQLGMVKSRDEVITGRELDLLSDGELKERIVD